MIKNPLRTTILTLGTSICILINFQSTANAIRVEDSLKNDFDEGLAYFVITPRVIDKDTGDLIKEGEKIFIKSPNPTWITPLRSLEELKEKRDQEVTAIDQKLAFQKAIQWQLALGENQEIVYRLGISIPMYADTDYSSIESSVPRTKEEARKKDLLKLTQVQEDIKSPGLLESALQYGVLERPLPFWHRYKLLDPVRREWTQERLQRYLDSIVQGSTASSVKD